MPGKAEGTADEWYVVQRWGVGERWGPRADGAADDTPGDGGAVWIAHPEEAMQRASAALVDDGDVWVVDPVDTPELDDLLSTLGEVRGVAVLLDRHWRDAGTVADRHDVPVYVPTWFSGVPDLGAPLERFRDRLPDTDYRARTVVDSRFWQETALFDGETLVVPESVGTVEYFSPGDERLGVHPMRRLFPPRGPLGGLGPERIVVGHGAGVDERATDALETALARARWGAPKAFVTALSGFVRG